MASFPAGQWHNGATALRRYFGPVTAPTVDDVEGLWNAEIDAARVAGEEPYYKLLLEQYKMYTEMADRISARRGLTNTFFLTFNTTMFSAIAFFFKDTPHLSRGLLVFPLLGLLIQCLAWYWLLRSYRQLNAGKYVVVGALEQRLPASPYWRAEWAALGKGAEPSRYLPLTHIEQLIPMLFAATYLLGFIAVLIS
ncbi:RipA family octameric membrane protein [Nocardia aurantia]|uniref:Small integral membrane protein n=1 Tax=Nocardia aurantia TaxID=2585199 RepID=A0A7K0DRF0_9NOCA|nr:hypothetical protein [Nocardia aurantia]MQY28117.1 hypothetical protein [Nocardia aurantia]